MRWTLGVLLWFVAGTFQFTIADDGVVVDGEIGAKIRDFVQQAHERAEFTGNVLAARHGQVVAAVSFGHTNGDDSPPITPSTLFEIGSTTKAVVSVAVFRLQEAGKLKIDDPIHRHLKTVPENCRGITIRHLLQHTSGIPKTNPADWHDDFDATLPLMLRGGPLAEPGNVGEYWNGGYGILSEIISRASGRPYQDYCREAVFQPSGMLVSRFTGDEPPPGIQVVTGTTPGQPSRTALEHPYPNYKYRGMGGLVTNVWEMWRLDRAMASRSFLRADSICEMTSNPINHYSPGWEIAASEDGQTCHCHSGSVRGFMSMYCRYPQIDGCLVIQINQQSPEMGSKMRELTRGCEQILLDRPLLVTFPEPLPREFAEQLAGQYLHARHGTFTVDKDSKGRINWKSGQVTIGRLQLNGSKELQWIDQTGRPLPLKVVRDPAKKIEQIALLGAEFKRVEKASP